MTALHVQTGTIDARSARPLLICGVVAGPLYVIIGLLQIAIREGFDPSRHALSLMSTGQLGWIQISNFILSGILVIASAIGVRRAMRGVKGGLWGPLLLGVYGTGLIGAGVFVADPMDGFPPGTPAGPPGSVSWHGGLHFLFGSVGFLAAIAACFVFTRAFAYMKRNGWAAFSAATGVLFLAALFGIASGESEPWIILSFTAAVLWLWAWISAVAMRLLRDVGN